MAAIDEAFWVDLDAHIVANRFKDSTVGPTEVIKLTAVADTSATADVPVAPMRRTASDWTGVLDTISAAKGSAEQQEARLREQAAANEALLQDLKRAQQRVHAFEVLMREMQIKAEAKERELQAQAEARIQKIQAKADAQVREAEERARAAQLQADAAEGWLKRIEQASKNLLPADRRAAA